MIPSVAYTYVTACHNGKQVGLQTLSVTKHRFASMPSSTPHPFCQALSYPAAAATASAVNVSRYAYVCLVLQSHVSEDGDLIVLVASSSTMKQDLLRLDLEQARLLTCLSHSWAQQVK